MSEAPASLPSPVDRYPGFRYRVIWSGRIVAGFRTASGLPQRARGSAPWTGGSPRPSIGPEGQGTQFFVSLEDEVSFDLAFGQWLSMVRCYGPATGTGTLCREYVRPISIREMDGDGGIRSVYHLSRCWVMEYTAAPGPDTAEREMDIALVKLGFESWEREPEEP